ncbi:MAG: hypothetical protein E6109_17435 [Ruminococcus sp.]|nr:hypothetical protein [Blautia wexlerae]MDU5441064.1 hypothetical protein [Ruminococcus sp.]NSF92278.1 hypothetical protein [Blautia wexlerae]
MNKEKALKNQGLEFREDIICGGRNGVSSPHLPPLFLFAGILVFCLSVPDNMSRIKSEAKE